MLENKRSKLNLDGVISGDLNGSSVRIGVLVASYNADISNGLLKGCLKGLSELGVFDDAITVMETDGAFELPLLAKRCIGSMRFDAIIGLGAVIKGDTAHFEYVAGECARGLQEVMLSSNKPVVFGVLTTLTEEQAIVRSSDDENNKGYESAYTAVKMCSLLGKINNFE